MQMDICSKRGRIMNLYIVFCCEEERVEKL